MTNKQLVIDALSRLPDEVSMDEIRERIAILASIRRGEEQIDRGLGIPHEDVKVRVAQWLSK